MGTDMKSALAVVLLLACVLGASATWTETLGDLAETTMLTSTGYTTSNCNCTNCDRGHHKLVDPEVASTTTECEAACDADSECRGSLHDSVGQERSNVKCFLYTQDITANAGSSSEHSRFSCYKKSGTVAQISTSGMTVTQSTTTHSGVASRAVDGNTAQSWGGGSCTHTTSASGNWWNIELGSTKWISHVKVWNRSDCCNTRLAGSYVTVGGSNCSGTLTDSTSSSGQQITCEEAGSSIGINSGNQGDLTICEVQIFGY